MSLRSTPSLTFLLTAVLFCGIAESPKGSGAFVYPVGDPDTKPSPTGQEGNGYKIVRGFGVHVSEGRHTGVDLANGQEGGEVRAFARGTVTEVRLVAPDTSSGFGNVVRIRHNIVGVGTVYSQYAHLMDGSIEVAPNELVEAGRFIGKIDCTGYTFGPTKCRSNGKSGPHLHFSIQVMDRRGCGYLPDSRCPNDTLVANYFDTNPLDLIERLRAGVCPITTTATDVPKAIPNPGQIVSTIMVPSDAGAIVDANVIFRFTHACERDLRMDLRAPDGLTVGVMDRGNQTCSGVVATFVSINPLITEFLAGRQGAGTWTLTVTDDGPGFSGTLDSWSLTLRVTGAAGQCSSVDDTFDDNALNSAIWAVEGPPPSGIQGVVTETNQQLQIANSAAGQSGAGIVSRWSFAGDFDVQVDYRLLNWPAFSGHSAELRGVDLPSGPFGGIGVARHSSRFSGEQYVTVFSSFLASKPTADITGKLRLVRSGTALFAFAHDSTRWIFVGAGGTSTSATRISLEAGSSDPSSPGGVVIAFDNFQVNAGQ